MPAVRRAHRLLVQQVSSFEEPHTRGHELTPRLARLLCVHILCTCAYCARALRDERRCCGGRSVSVQDQRGRVALFGELRTLYQFEMALLLLHLTCSLSADAPRQPAIPNRER